MWNGISLWFWFLFPWWLMMLLLAICISSLEKCLFKTFACFWIGLSFLLLNYKTSLYILLLDPYQVCVLQVSSPILQVVSSFSWCCPLMHRRLLSLMSNSSLFGCLCFSYHSIMCLQDLSMLLGEHNRWLLTARWFSTLYIFQILPVPSPTDSHTTSNSTLSPATWYTLMYVPSKTVWEFIGGKLLVQINCLI